jgi:hypothetical protein
MTDSNETPATVTPAEEPTDQRPSQERLPAGFWVLVVIAAFIALAALWFALFGNPQVIGPDTGATSGSVSTTSPGGTATLPTGPITVRDVEAVLAQVDYTETTDTPTFEYNETLAHVTAGVDTLAFAKQTLEATPAIWWVETGTNAARDISGARKDALVAEALANWNGRLAEDGTRSALVAMLDVPFKAPNSATRTRQDSLLQVITQGLAPLGLMFGANDEDDNWTWAVRRITVTGLDSADVAYSASTRPGAPWQFVDPSAVYVKRLVFTRTPAGRWQLAGWPNHAEVSARFRSNVTPPGAVTDLDEWWGSL